MIRKKIVFCVSVLIFLITSFFLMTIDRRLNSILTSYIDSEVEKVAYYTVGKIVDRIQYDNPSNYLIISRDSDNKIERISYNTDEINILRKEILDITQEECLNVEKGLIDNNFFIQQTFGRQKFKYIKYGYLCEISLSSIRNSSLFGNVGPTIPIKLSFMGYNDVDVDIDIKEYGINNVLVQINVVISLNCIVTMPISSSVHNVVVQEPISVELIKGEVPSYFSST